MEQQDVAVGRTGKVQVEAPAVRGGSAWSSARSSGPFDRHPRGSAAIRPEAGYHCPPVTTAPNDFTHLHVHSEFSLLDGLGRITELVDTAAQLGMDLMAITDHGALYGAVAFYQAAKSKGIKPIIGVETYVARRSMTDKEGQGRRSAVPPDPAGPGHRSATRTCAGSSRTPTSTAITTSRGSTGSTWRATARG